MTDPKLLDLRGVADLLGVSERTVRNYHQQSERIRREGWKARRRDMPPPDYVFGRSPVWKASTIRSWQKRRPGRGVGGGRPRKEVTE